MLGDLYLEAHRSKHELYVVTDIADCWPDRRGAIRLGVNQELRRAYSSDAEFRAAFLGAARDYETVRRQADNAQGNAQLPPDEHEKRMNLERFTSLVTVAPGDVIDVPPWVPHSLQHGVRVVEFQTPTYERLIIAFAQQVRTQDHWDSEAAIGGLQLDPPATCQSTPIGPGLEALGECADFSAWRVTLQPDTSTSLPLSLPYAVCINIRGSVLVNGLRRDQFEGCFVPACSMPVVLENNSPATAQCLIASQP